MKRWCAVGIEAPKNPLNVGTTMRTAAAFGADAVFIVGMSFGVDFGLKMLELMQKAEEPCCSISAHGGTCRCAKTVGKVTGDTTKLSEGRLPLTTLADGAALEGWARSMDATIVAVERVDGSVKLNHLFQHAERAIYLLGNEGTGLTKAARAGARVFVEIDTVFPLDVATAAGIVLYDRYVKEALTVPQTRP